MRIATIDSGNTLMKLGKFNEDKLLELQAFNYGQMDAAFKAIFDFQPMLIVVSDVSGKSHSLIAELKNSFSCIELQSGMRLPIEIGYDTPATLGVDRIAVSIGAKMLFPEKACLVLDCGTCLTIDFTDSKNTYQGGSISPGYNMRMRAMHHFTSRLPEIEAIEPDSFVGKNTIACMQSGAFFGMLDEINAAIARYKESFGDMQVLICGGDADLFAKHIKNNIFAAPELIHFGLYQIAKHYVS